MTRYLITTVPQIDGGLRELYARTRREAVAARQLLHDDPTMVDHLAVSEYVDVSRDGNRERFVIGG